MKNLSKSKLMAYRQCEKRLWLDLTGTRKPEYSEETKARFAAGHAVGELARRLYDPKGRGNLIDIKIEGVEEALLRTKKLLQDRTPIFEAGFANNGAQAFADILLPVKVDGKEAWRMIEVKSSTSVDEHYHDDAAIQHFVAQKAGVRLSKLALAHIDSEWVYQGAGDYDGFLVENDLTASASNRSSEVLAWIKAAQKIAGKRTEPKIRTGPHCDKPHACGYLNYCSSQEKQAKYPVQWLPRVQTKALKAHLESEVVRDLRDVPNDLLNARQLRVKQHTLSGKTYFDAVGAKDALKGYGLPAYFLDFETIQYVIPIWKGTSPYQIIPFQFSCHRLSRTGKLEQDTFLDLSGQDPSRGCAEALLVACGASGPIFAYNASFEASRIRMLAERFPKMSKALRAICDRLVDLRPIAEKVYYHTDQKGSWSLKAVIPTMPGLVKYPKDAVHSGGGAMLAYSEAVHESTTAARKAELSKQLLWYCALDTLALVRLWQKFSGRSDLKIPAEP